MSYSNTSDPDAPITTSGTFWWNVTDIGISTRLTRIAYQVFTDSAAKGRMFLRHKHDSGWSKWYVIPNVDDCKTLSPRYNLKTREIGIPEFTVAANSLSENITVTDNQISPLQPLCVCGVYTNKAALGISHFTTTSSGATVRFRNNSNSEVTVTNAYVQFLCVDVSTLLSWWN